MRRIAAAVLLLLAACATREASRVAGDPTTTPEASRHDEDADGWFLRSISQDQKTLEIQYTMSGVASGCERKGNSYAEESAEQVVVHAVKSVLDDRNVPCTEELAYVDATITLDEPLGDRLLLGCLQTWEQDEFPDAVGDERGEDKFCRGTTRGAADAPPAGGDY